MDRFEQIEFRGDFRSYQQKVLEGANRYLTDGKINIVAAPGSGKTVLGLELIRRLGHPCLILSPTTAIREQWGERFRSMFLRDESEFVKLFSTDLHKIKLINSITYQALYSAMERVIIEDEGETDCSDIELLKIIKENGIKTICLDEAHHLRNEWQKALEKFMELMDGEVKLIALTATPPYDSENAEWKRYYKICGEIDEEIFVPELVAQETLCPHQDYVYFNYPTEKEIAAFEVHKHNVAMALQQIRELGFWETVRDALCAKENWESLYEFPKEYIRVLMLLGWFGADADKKTIKMLTGQKRLPKCKLLEAEQALQFLIGKECTVLSEEQKDEICDIAKTQGVYEKRKITLVLDEELKRSLVKSLGKLDSIVKIAGHEWKTMKNSLRMLVLTDYICKENISKIGTEESFDSVNIVSIFESIRRSKVPAALGVLSGSLIILPESIDLSKVKHRKKELSGTGYCVVEFAGDNHDAVKYVGQLFKEGKIQILIGTKSLLGEGWDAPCINSLILASFVGSFVLSNQMRGRAIRIDKENPEKVSNIWHLVTVEPEHVFSDNAWARKGVLPKAEDSLLSTDYELLLRRFDCFMGPNYTTGKIESGIDRLTAIKGPYNKQGIARINETMLEKSAQREKLRNIWKQELSGKQCNVVLQTDAVKEHKVPSNVFIDWKIIFILSLTSFISSVFLQMSRFIFVRNDIGGMLPKVLMAALVLYILVGIRKWYLHRSPATSIRTLGVAVYETMRDCGILAASANVHTEEVANVAEVGFTLQLRNASIHDQNLFHTAMDELLSPIENPRYLIIKRKMAGKYNYQFSFACPAIIGKKKEYVEVLCQKLKRSMGNMEVVYTHQPKGRELILTCRKKAYLTKIERLNASSKKKYVVSRLE